MTIRMRILLGFLITIIVTGGSILTYVIIAMSDNAKATYKVTSTEKLQIMNNYIEGFVKTAEQNAALLAQDAALVESAGLFRNFSGTTQKEAYRHAELPPAAQAALQPFVRLGKGNEDYVEVYAGFADGGYASSIDGTSVPIAYNPSARPWYVQRAGSDKAVGLADSYLSITGELVFAVTHKIADRAGKTIGVFGLDISLKGLSQRFAQLNFGNTGSFMLIESTGRILCAPRTPELVGKIIGKDINDKGLWQILDARNGAFEVTLTGVDMWANVYTTPFGWKLAALQTDQEIYSGTRAAIRSVVFITLGIALLMLALAYALARSINKPLQRIVTVADDIARGQLTVSLDGREFFGELSELRAALLNMVDNLKGMINTAEQKSREAEDQAQLARIATEKAEAAQRAAESARHDGMLAAAQELEGAVVVISSVSDELTVRIEQSKHITSESANRLSEAATAMNQMNATVQEVARNAAAASSMSDKTRANAESGSQIVQQALQSISQVQSVSEELKADMTQLNEHATAISHIMGVISDIADQTNLLALNAAIEAARAGDAGRGFAVVADEVRKLAEKTMISTTDVGNTIKAIQASTDKSVSSTDNALHLVEKAAGFASQSNEALRQILQNVGITADQVSAIATASEEQSAASEEINRSILQVNTLSDDTAQTMNVAAQAMSDLAKQVKNLSDLVATMKKS